MIRKTILALVSLTSITAQAGEIWLKSGNRIFFAQVPLSKEEISRLSKSEKIGLLQNYDVWEFEDLRYKGYDGFKAKPAPHMRPGVFTDTKRKEKPTLFTDPPLAKPCEWTDC